MNNMIDIKAFILQKDGSPNSCKDSIALDTSLGRFAIADGVTNSYHPKLLARDLCKTYIEGDYNAIDWQSYFKQMAFDTVCNKWNERVEQLESNLSEWDLEIVQTKHKNFPYGASTLAGINVDIIAGQIFYHIIGDSCLFLIGKDNGFRCFCTCNSVQKDGYRYYLFGDSTQSIISDVSFSSQLNWLEGTTPIETGYAVLMTDGAAKWFQDAMLENSQTIEDLWKLNTHEEFVRFVEEKREMQMMDDDISIIMLKFNHKWKKGFEPLIIDVWQDYPTELLHVDRHESKPPMMEELNVMPCGKSDDNSLFIRICNFLGISLWRKRK